MGLTINQQHKRINNKTRLTHSRWFTNETTAGTLQQEGSGDQGRLCKRVSSLQKDYTL